MITIIVHAIKRHNLPNSSPELLSEILVNTIGKMERGDTTNTRNTLRNLEPGTRRQNLSCRRNHALCLRPDGVNGDVQLVKGNSFNRVASDSSVVVRTTLHTGFCGILLCQKTGAAVGVPNLGGDAKCEIRVQVFCVDHAIGMRDIAFGG